MATALPPCQPPHAHEWGMKGTNKRVRKYTCKHCQFWVQEKPDTAQEPGGWAAHKSGYAAA